MTTINTIHCADCGEFLSLNGQTVSCARCIRRGSPTATGSLAQTILAIETQASETGHSLDVSSLKADGRGRLTFSVKKLVDTTVGGKAASRTPVKRLA